MAYDRRAFLHWIRNVFRGLSTRTKIIQLMETGKTSTREIAEIIGISAATVYYHLKNLERENIVRYDTKTREWRLLPQEQISLQDFLS